MANQQEIFQIAYVDPGSGALLLQVIIAWFAAFLFLTKRVRVFLVRLIARWRRKK